MEFFNKKEEVLDFQITSYGKNLLATGNFKPVFYAFLDDEILYDVSGSGMTEKQNVSEGRIQSDTPMMKVSPTITGAETRVQQFIDNVTSSFATVSGQNSDPANNVGIFQQQPYGDRERTSYLIGRSSLSSEYAPAWKAEILSTPELSSSTRYLDTDGQIDNIPQLDITIDYETYFQKGILSSDSITGYYGDTNFFLALKENYLMMEIIEENTDFEKENYEIEIFLSEPEGEYIQKSFAPVSETEFILPSDENVEYFMNILVDDEIPPDVVSELNIDDRALFSNASRLKLNRDLYSTENEEPC